MPHIIKLKRRDEDQPGVTVSRVVAQCAVMTLDEDEIKRRLFHWREGDKLSGREQRILDVIWGQAFNPIFDGTVVEVSQVEWEPFATDAGYDYAYVTEGGVTEDELIDAFNKEHS